MLFSYFYLNKMIFVEDRDVVCGDVVTGRACRNVACGDVACGDVALQRLYVGHGMR